MPRLNHCISISDFSKNDLLELLKSAERFEANHSRPTVLKDKVIASLFFEPSTRTRLSFESATKYLGAQVIGFAEGTTSSTQKGESLEDTIRTISRYCDGIVLRHPEAGSAKRAAKVSTVPVVNAGDGSNEHPTQTLLDIYSIQKTQGKLEGLNIGLAGDLKFGRTVHSLIKALAQFKNHFVLITPDEIKLQDEYLKIIEDAGSTYEERKDFSKLNDLDILYMTRTQKERFSSEEAYNKVKDALVLNAADLKDVRKNCKVLHPLPRVNELAEDVDEHPAAYYFDQVQNGLYIRQALLELLIS